LDAVRERVAWLEYFPYHSEVYSSLPEGLPSQQFTFELLRHAIANGTPVVALRSRKLWSAAVPELYGYSGLIEARNPRVSAVSPGTLGAVGFTAVVEALVAGHSDWD